MAARGDCYKCWNVFNNINDWCLVRRLDWSLVTDDAVIEFRACCLRPPPRRLLAVSAARRSRCQICFHNPRTRWNTAYVQCSSLLQDLVFPSFPTVGVPPRRIRHALVRLSFPKVAQGWVHPSHARTRMPHTGLFHTRAKSELVAAVALWGTNQTFTFWFLGLKDKTQMLNTLTKMELCWTWNAFFHPSSRLPSVLTLPVRQFKVSTCVAGTYLVFLVLMWPSCFLKLMFSSEKR